MSGVESEIFGGIIRNSPTTVNGFVKEATNMERALQAPSTHYQRHPAVPTLATSGPDLGTDLPGICDIIREVVQEELKKLLPTAAHPASLSIAEVAREEVQRVIQPEVPVIVALPEEPVATYAAIAR